jgi:hypothetical protein
MAPGGPSSTRLQASRAARSHSRRQVSSGPCSPADERGGSTVPTDCGHACCEIPTNPAHVHTTAPTECHRCRSAEDPLVQTSLGYAVVGLAFGSRCER